ncbi:MAG TPA: glycoside hydrolase family 57 protein [Terriglobales bacterium]|nr:glycoside hydrolase family 57 protein [Terriglobales bacterium]
MARLRVVFLWHMHQPFYKDLVAGEYRLPWVRLHALKDYYGMVKLLEEFPAVHQTFNLVPSLVAQLQDYVAGTARDPFLEVVAKPATELTPEEQRFALEYLFQANPTHMIGRYPRYRQLWESFRSAGENAERAAKAFSAQDFTDLQVLSQLAWFDEFFHEEPDVRELVKKGSGFDAGDQRFIVERQRELMSRVLPAYQEAAQRGSIELSCSPFYHPILPLLCDTEVARAASPGLPLPQERFRHPEDAAEQLRRAIEFHEKTFGTRPRGAWPSEGSVSEEVLALAHEAGLEWMATDEGILARTQGSGFPRDGSGRLLTGGAERLYNIYRYEKDGASLHLLFRDHTVSDMIGFVYAGVPAEVAAVELIRRIKESAQSVLNAGRDAVVSVILDGENAWEYYPHSGREFLRRLYAGISGDPVMEAVTVWEAIERHSDFGRLGGIAPGSWINANFEVWIGPPEDNRAWEYLSAARNFYQEAAPEAAEDDRRLAWEEILIAEGSDWNWWYGPHHHSANDREFDELYRKHLSNVYHLLGATPPEALAQPIARVEVRPHLVGQTAFIRPTIDGELSSYFEWLGAASCVADRRTSAMHGKQYVLGSIHAGVNDTMLFGRLDFVGGVPPGTLEVVIKLESTEAGSDQIRQKLLLEIAVEERVISGWSVRRGEEHPGHEEEATQPASGLVVRLSKVLEFALPLAELGAARGNRIRLRCSVWRDHLPVDALPLEGWLDLDVVSEEELAARA